MNKYYMLYKENGKVRIKQVVGEELFQECFCVITKENLDVLQNDINKIFSAEKFKEL